jgi:RNA polymerase sigma-70 factor, ECF subfamily
MNFWRRAGSAGFDDLYARYGPTIYARCRQMLRDRAAAEDITQETFIQAYWSLRNVGGERETLAWLYRTATNRCLNELRNGRHRPMLMEAPPDRGSPPLDERLLDHDLVARLALRLPEDLAMVAWLYHVDGHKQAYIAEICGISRRTVIARLGRFLEFARGFIDGSEHESAG